MTSLPRPNQVLSCRTFHDDLRWSAIYALGELGPNAVEALPVLTEMSKNARIGDNLSTRIEEAIGKIRGEIGPDARGQ